MARRKELKNIASGMYGSFISRNNDVDGYWGIGKLCLLAQKTSTSSVRVDLLGRTMTPKGVGFSKLVLGYHSILHRLLASKAIPSNWVVSAVIELNFKPEHPFEKHIPIVTWGNLFKLTVAITDDMGKVHVVDGYNYCGPHDPRRELKSAGTQRF